jgi:murein L,D-transpeptidase YcbB/YkuD
VLDPAAVDWDAVAEGRKPVRLRQRPGPGNIMGRVKFIFPNRLGVYLHDTPDRAWLARDRRTASSGCVRLGDAPALARRLLGADVDALAAGAPAETRVDLPDPIPVYLVYLTVRPTRGGLETRPDIYGRDAPLLKALSA